MSSQTKDAAQRRGAARTAQVEVKVREAMETIKREMKENEGIYPRNGGAVSMNEVARVAKISQTTLFSPRQRVFGQTVKAWVDSMKKKELVGRVRVRRTFQERTDDWRKKFLDLQDAHIATELEFQDTKSMLERAQEDVAKLRAENAILREQIHLAGASKVSSLKNRN